MNGNVVQDNYCYLKKTKICLCFYGQQTNKESLSLKTPQCVH